MRCSATPPTSRASCHQPAVQRRRRHPAAVVAQRRAVVARHPSLASLSLPPNLQGAPSPTNIGGGGGGGGGGSWVGWVGLTSSPTSAAACPAASSAAATPAVLWRPPQRRQRRQLSGGSLGGLGGAGSGGLSGRLSSGGSSSGASAAAFQHLTSDDGALDGMHDALLGYFNSSGGAEGDEDGTGGLLGAALPWARRPCKRTSCPRRRRVRRRIGVVSTCSDRGPRRGAGDGWETTNEGLLRVGRSFLFFSAAVFVLRSAELRRCERKGAPSGAGHARPPVRRCTPGAGVATLRAALVRP